MAKREIMKLRTLRDLHIINRTLERMNQKSFYWKCKLIDNNKVIFARAALL